MCHVAKTRRISRLAVVVVAWVRSMGPQQHYHCLPQYRTEVLRKLAGCPRLGLAEVEAGMVRAGVNHSQTLREALYQCNSQGRWKSCSGAEGSWRYAHEVAVEV